jgi:hypothetical protein
LSENLLQQIDVNPLKWRLVAIFAHPGDPNRAAEVWPENRKHVVMGEFTLTDTESEAPGNCRDLNFDPMILAPDIRGEATQCRVGHLHRSAAMTRPIQRSNLLARLLH